MSLCHEGQQRGRRKHPNWGHPDHDACGTGFIAQLASPPSHDIVQYALNALERLTHRGGVDADGASGDGAGLLTSIPHLFSARGPPSNPSNCPSISVWALRFFQRAPRDDARRAVEAAADTERLRVLGWRRVPVNTAVLGPRSLETMPEAWQFYVSPFHATREPRNLSFVWHCCESAPSRCCRRAVISVRSRR